MIDPRDTKIANEKIATLRPLLLKALRSAGLEPKPHPYSSSMWLIDGIVIAVEEATRYERNWPRRSFGKIRASVSSHTCAVRTRTICEGKNGLSVAAIVRAAVEVHAQTKAKLDADRQASDKRKSVEPLARELNELGRPARVNVFATPRGLEVCFERTEATEAFIRKLIAFVAGSRE